MSDELKDELKPCPFCGKKPKINQSEFSRRYWVACEDCCCLNKVFYTKDEAIKAWNTRPIEDEKDNQIKELKHDLAFSDKWTKMIENLVPFEVYLDILAESPAESDIK